MRRILVFLAALCLFVSGIVASRPSQAVAAHVTIRSASVAVTTLLGPGTYSNVGPTTTPLNPPVCEFVSINLNQLNTPGPGQTANLSGTFLASQDGVTWANAGDFTAFISWTDITTFNKNGVHPVPPSGVFGTPYAPHLKVRFQLTGTASVQSITLNTN